MLKKIPISYRGAPKWRYLPGDKQKIPSGTPLLSKQLSCRVSPPAPPADSPPQTRPNLFWIACPTCGYWREVAKTTLLSECKWAKVMCMKCDARRTASRWKCPCGVRWSTCQEHADEGFACKTIKMGPKGKHKGRKGCKRSAFSLDQDGFPFDPEPKRVRGPRARSFVQIPSASSRGTHKGYVWGEQLGHSAAHFACRTASSAGRAVAITAKKHVEVSRLICENALAKHIWNQE